tara:strand:- start:215 stop:1135 length:921 start_codon:yes stop_codon:yes gene_type:complete
MSLSDIHKNMTQHYLKTIEKNKTKLDKLENEVEYIKHSITLGLKDEDEKKGGQDDVIYEKETKIEELNKEIKLDESKLNIFDSLNNEYINKEDCPICLESLENLTKTITPCGHLFCASCIYKTKKNTNMKCALCRQSFNSCEIKVFDSEIEKECVEKLGTKLTYMIQHLDKILIENDENRIIIFSQWNNMLKMISKVLSEKDFKFVFFDGSIHVVNNRIKKFKLDKSYRIVLLSSDKSVSGLNLTEASHIILLDTLNHEKKEIASLIEEQAIGRAVRIGQTKNVKVERFIIRNSIEHDYFINNTVS